MRWLTLVLLMGCGPRGCTAPGGCDRWIADCAEHQPVTVCRANARELARWCE